MKLVKSEERVRLADLPQGRFFTKERLSQIAFKTQYTSADGACECYLYGSGARFWGGTATADELNNLLVYPVIMAV